MQWIIPTTASANSEGLPSLSKAAAAFKAYKYLGLIASPIGVKNGLYLLKFQIPWS